MKIEFDEQCSPCKGTGVYQGMGERDGYAVVCHICKGTGKHHFIHEYEEFTGRKEAAGITKIIESNPGICVGGDTLDFGGISYSQWKTDGIFPSGSEMRQYVCPCWWYQSADYKKKPKWVECDLGAFSSCRNFPTKQLCWDRFDKEAAE